MFSNQNYPTLTIFWSEYLYLKWQSTSFNNTPINRSQNTNTTYCQKNMPITIPIKLYVLNMQLFVAFMDCNHAINSSEQQFRVSSINIRHQGR